MAATQLSSKKISLSPPKGRFTCRGKPSLLYNRFHRNGKTGSADGASVPYSCFCNSNPKGMSMNDEQFNQAESFWMRKDAAARAIDEQALQETIDEFLSSRTICALATGGADFVRCTPLEYRWRNHALWVFSEGSLKFKALRSSNRVSVAVFDTDGSFGNLKSAQIQGTAVIVDPFSDEYNAAAEARSIPLEALRALPEPMWLIKIVPDEITLLNSAFKQEGFGSRQTWRAS